MISLWLLLKRAKLVEGALARAGAHYGTLAELAFEDALVDLLKVVRAQFELIYAFE